MWSDSDSDSDDEYIPTPLRMPVEPYTINTPARTFKKPFKPITPCNIPSECCIMELPQIQKFIEQINRTRGCKTTGCQGKLVPLFITTHGMGGAATLRYTCDGCMSEVLEFETSSKTTDLARTNVSIAKQVALIAAGCTHATYYKVLQQAMGIGAVGANRFMLTVESLHPVVQKMVNDMCEREKNRMKAMDQTQLGSWSRAVTCADGTWMTRGFHSKNATFSVRNYFTGALLYFIHICQKGRDHIIGEELYKGTSKSAEGYAARKTLLIAKEEKLNIEVHWQDADSSSSKSVEEIYPGAKVMTCGGHTGRAHLKQLQKFGKKKSFTPKFKDLHRENFPEIDTVACHCDQHSLGCGCLSEVFCQKARNNFSRILSDSSSANEFSERLLALTNHVQDIHQWEGGQCQFSML